MTDYLEFLRSKIEAAHDVSAYTAVTKYKPVCVSDDD